MRPFIGTEALVAGTVNRYQLGTRYTDPRQRSRDIDRIAELTALGWLIVRVSGEMLRHRPAVIVGRVCGALRERGVVIAESA